MTTQAVARAKGAHATIDFDRRILRVQADGDREEPVMLAQQLLSAGRVADACQVVQVALGREEDDPELLFVGGCAFEAQAALDWSQVFFTRAAAAAPDWVEPLRGLARVLIRRDQKHRAADVLTRALVLCPRDPGLLALRQRAEPPTAPANEQRTDQPGVAGTEGTTSPPPATTEAPAADGLRATPEPPPSKSAVPAEELHAFPLAQPEAPLTPVVVRPTVTLRPRRRASFDAPPKEVALDQLALLALAEPDVEPSVATTFPGLGVALPDDATGPQDEWALSVGLEELLARRTPEPYMPPTPRELHPHPESAPSAAS